MTSYYAATIYDTAADVETFIETVATTVTFDLIAYRDGSTSKFMYITPAPNLAT